MKDLKTIKYIIMAAGVIASAAFYVMSGSGPGTMGYVRLDEAEAASGPLETAGERKERSGEEGYPAPGSGLSEDGIREWKDLMREAVREELSAAVREGWLWPPEQGVSAHDGPESKAREGMVDLNSADKEELMTLPGIGEKKAEDILAYRRSHGGFQNIEEIMQISGIKSAAFQKIRDKIYV